MKNTIMCLALLSAVGCMHTPTNSASSSPSSGVSGDMSGPGIPGPTPNVGFDRADIEGGTVTDQDGAIAPVVACKANEVREEQSGSIVCVPSKKADRNTTTGR